MSSRRLAIGALGLCVALAGCPPREELIPKPIQDRARDGWRAFQARYTGSRIEWDSATGVAAEVRTFRAQVTADSPRAGAEEFLRRNHAVFGMDSTLRGVEFVEVATSDTEADDRIRYVRFRQTVGSVPIVGTETVVHVTDSGRVFRTYNRFYPDVPVFPRPRLSLAQAIEIAKTRGGATSFHRLDDKGELVIWPGPEFHLAWQVQVGDRQVTVDATDGEILDNFVNRYEVQGQGRVFDQNRCTTPTRSMQPLPNLDNSTFLRGTSFDVQHWNMGNRVSEPTRIYDYAESEPSRLAQTEIYFQLERASAYFAGLGFATNPGQMVAIAQAPREACGAAYYPGFDLFMFGNRAGGCNNPGWDGDVIVHEYTHKVTEQRVVLGRDHVQLAIREAVSDYYAATIFDDPCMGETLTSNCGCFRDLDNGFRWPRDRGSDVHTTGRILGGAMFEIRQLIGAQTADRVFYDALAGLPADANFSDFAVGSMDAFAASLGELENWIEIFIVGAAMVGMGEAFCNHGIRLPDAYGRCPFIDWWEGPEFTGRMHNRTLFADDGGDCLPMNINDAMHSIRFYGRPGWRLMLYDSPSCSTADDWGEITFPDDPGGVVELPRIGRVGEALVRPPGAYEFHRYNGLPGRVSAIRHLP